jgi:formate hydrogenlyase subunit 4
VLGALLIGITVPVHTGNLWIDIPVAIAGMMGLAVLIGVIESVMARLRLLRSSVARGRRCNFHNRTCSRVKVIFAGPMA